MKEDDLFLCLSDFVCLLLLGIIDKIGVFVIMVDVEMEWFYVEDDYKCMLV